MPYVKQIEHFWRYYGTNTNMQMLNTFTGIQGAHWLIDEYETLELSLLQQSIIQVKEKAYRACLHEVLSEGELTPERVDIWSDIFDSCKQHLQDFHDSIDISFE